MAAPMNGVSLATRIGMYVDTSAGTDGCHPWMGYKSGGYGRLRYRGKRVYVARIVLEASLGRKLRDGEITRHRCDNPPCCNPAHLLPGTDADNSGDAVARGRLVSGERHRLAKLTWDDVAEIRKLSSSLARGDRSALAKRFGVARQTIDSVVRGRSWKGVLCVWGSP
jgi:hypothetical protein